MRCQKQFARNYEPMPEQNFPADQSWKRTALAAVVWLALNAVIVALYLTVIFDRGILILIALAYIEQEKCSFGKGKKYNRQ